MAASPPGTAAFHVNSVGLTSRNARTCNLCNEKVIIPFHVYEEMEFDLWSWTTTMRMAPIKRLRNVNETANA